MSNLAPEKLVIAISSRALFNLDAEHLVYEEQGLRRIPHIKSNMRIRP